VTGFRKDGAGEELSGLSLYELMHVLMAHPADGGLGVVAALNLDGGTSSAMSISHPDLYLDIRSTHPVRNAVAVARRE